MPTQTTVAIHHRRQVIEERIAAIRRTLKKEEERLEELQEICPHPNKETHIAYESRTYSCPDCGKFWTTL